MRLSPRIQSLVVTLMALLLAGCAAESKRLRQLERAAEHQKAGDYERARIEYQNVLQKFPDDITAIEGLATIWHDRGATMRAMAYLTRLSPLATGNLGARIKRAQLMAALGLRPEARREAQAILERSTTAGEALVVLAETVRDAGELKDTEDLLQQFPEKQTVWFHLASATLLNFRGDRAGARLAVGRAITLDPNSPAAHAAMGAIQALLNNPEQAAASCKKAAELSPVRSRFRLQYAAYLAQSGDLPGAMAALSAITKEAPDSQSAWRGLAQFALAEKRPTDALALLDKVLALDASDYDALLLRARIWHMQGETAKAIAEYQRLSGLFPGIGLELPHLGIALLQNNDVTGATAALEQAAERFPDNLEVVQLLAQLDLRAGQHERVLGAMARVLGRRPDLVQPYLLMIDAAKGAGKLDALVGVFQQNLAANPKNSLLHFMLGLTYRQQEKPTEARQSFEMAVELAPNLTAAVVELGNLDAVEGKTASALQRAHLLIEKAPKLAVGPLLAARVYALEKKWPEAEAAAIEALLIDHNQAPAYGVLVESWSARKGEPGTAARVEAFLAKFPGELFALRIAAQALVDLGEYNRGRDLYEQFLAKSPDFALVLNNLANLYADHLKQPDRALELARKARAAAPADPSIADTLGWILYQRKEYPEALTLLEESVKALSANGVVQYHLGLANRALGRTEPALGALRLAVAANGDFPGKAEAKRVLAEMESAK